MVLEFRPPTDLIDAYLNRPSPGQQASQGIQQALQTYAQTKMAEHKSKNEALQTLLKAADSVDLSDPATAKAFSPLYKDAGVDPSIFQPPTPSTATAPSPAPVPAPQAAAPPVTAGVASPATGSPVTQAPPAVSPVIQASIAAGHPNHTGVVNTVGDPNQLVKTSFGRKKLAAAESVNRFTDQQTAKAEKDAENARGTFDYVRGLAKSSGVPDVADPFIENAQKQGRDRLTGVEMKDLQTAITANASQKRGDFYEGSLDVKRQAQKLAMTKFAMEQTGGKSLMEASKVATDRLAQFKRANGVLDQITFQGDQATKRQAAEASISTVKGLVGSGVATDSQINSFIPETLRTKYRDYNEFLSSDADAEDFKSFKNELQSLIKREIDINQEIVGAAQDFGRSATDLLAERYPNAAKHIKERATNNPLISPIPTISNDAAFNALPSGAQFKDPAGQVHRKK